MILALANIISARRGGGFNPLSLNPSQYCELKVTSNDIYFEDKNLNANHIDLVGSPWFQTVSTMGAGPQKTSVDVGTITEFSIGITIILDDSYVTNAGLFHCFGLALRPNATTQNLTVVAAPHTVTATPSNSMPLGSVKRIWVTTKSGGRQKVYIDGQVVSDVAAGTFSYSGAQNLKVANYSARPNARFCNFQIFNKQLSDSDIAYDFDNKYHTVFDNPTFSLAGTYTTAKDIMLLWWKFAEGYGTTEFDASGNPITVGGVQQTVAKWVRLNCNVPNTLVTIKGVQYDVFNAQLLAGSVNGNPFIVDNPLTWPSSLHRDNIHPNTFALACLAVKMYLILEQNNW